MGPVLLVRCPKCATLMPLDHDVSSGGYVTPSLQCPICDFHEWVVLANWVPK